jgi:hypothetical protein
LSLVGAFVVCASLHRWRSARFLRFESILLPIAVCLGLLVWFGFDQVRMRLGSIWSAPASEEGRIVLWRDTVRITWDFPLWGTGYGTFQYVEPLVRKNPSDVLNEHAHNEYLEAAIEGGVLRFGLTLLCIALLVRLGYRAFRRHEWSPAGGLVMGALFGLATVVLHSFVEFGVHIPAVSVLVTDLAAVVCALSSPAPLSVPVATGASQLEMNASEYSVRGWGITPALVAAVSLLLGLTLVASGATAAKTQILLRAARRFNERAEPVYRDRWIAYLEAAAATAPDFARVRIELAQAHLEVLHQERERLEGSSGREDEGFAIATERLNREHLLPALRHYLSARDLCPLLGEPHLQIAAHVGAFEHADSAAAYLDRAKLVMPHDPEVWYLSGLDQLLDGHHAEAWKNWRHSLDLSGFFLPEITAAAAAILGDQGLIIEVLPERPDILVRAAFYRYPNSDQVAERRPFFEKAYSLLVRQGSEITDAERLYVEAMISRNLGN